MSSDELVQRGRESFQLRAWADAYAHLAAADREDRLDPEDLERLATAAYLVAQDADSTAGWERAYHAFRRQGNAERAARCAFWLGSALLERGEAARGGGWIARARRLLDLGGRECVEQGYLLLPIALRCIAEGDYATAYTTFGKAAQVGERYGDPELVTLARHGEGRTLIRLGRTAEGMTTLDEAMVAITAGEVSPMIAGDVYCGVLSACQEVFDLHRAQEWTAALTQWCAAQPQLVPYRGQCLVRRAEILQLHGSWPEAVAETQQACEWLSRPPGQPGLGAALYQQGELQRLRGDFPEAEGAYRQASQLGRTPQPGLALLRLAQGQVTAAAAAIRQALDEARESRTRARTLAAYVEIMLVDNDVPAARAAAEELGQIAADLDAAFLHAVSSHATGAVLLAEGNARDALSALHRACAIWRQLNAPYEAARAGILVGLASRALGDTDTATMELNAARQALEHLGAVADLKRLAELSRAPGPNPPGGLTGREVQVLRLIATGKTNRAIARDLSLSEKTVARHVSNIFTKLGLSSRAAATAYAYRHKLQ